MGLKYDARLDLSALSDALEKRGLTPGGRVQKAVDEAVIRYCDPKVPFRTGTLKHSAITASAIGDQFNEFDQWWCCGNAGGGKGGHRGSKTCGLADWKYLHKRKQYKPSVFVWRYLGKNF